jgi:hypothetical protein
MSQSQMIRNIAKQSCSVINIIGTRSSLCCQRNMMMMKQRYKASMILLEPIAIHLKMMTKPDQPESPAHSLTPSEPPSSQDDALLVPSKMGCKATTSVSMIGSPLHYPSLEV